MSDRDIRIQRIKKKIEKLFSIEDILVDSRESSYVRARVMFIYYLKAYEHLTYKEVGLYVNRSRGSLINAVSSFKRDIEQDKDMISIWNYLMGITEVIITPEEAEQKEKAGKFDKLNKFFPLFENVVDLGLEDEVFSKMELITKAIIINKSNR